MRWKRRRRCSGCTGYSATYKHTDFSGGITLFAGPPEHGAGGSAEQGVEEWPVVVEEGPQQVGHREGDVLPVAVGKDVALL